VVSKWLFLSRESTRTALSKAEILGGREEYERISEPSNGTGPEYVASNWLWKHRVSVVPDPPEYKITEEVYVSWIWYLASFGSFLVLVTFEGILSGLVSSFVFFGLFGYLFSHRSPLDDFWEESQSSGEDVIAVVMLLFLLGPLVLLEFWFRPPDLAMSVLSTGAYGGYWLGESYFIRASEWWQSRVVEWTDDLPYVMLDYSVMLFLMSVPMIIFHFLWPNTAFLLSLVGSRLILLMYSLIFSVIWIGMIWRLHTQSFNYTRVSYSSEGQKQGRLRNSVLAGMAVCLSLLFGGVGWWFFRRVAILFSVDVVVGVAVGLSTGWPVLLVVSGLLYQELRIWRLVLNWYLKSTEEDLCPDIELDSSVRVVNSDSPIAGAVSTGLYDFIVVSDTLVERLGEKELEVVLAHEEGHIQHGDAQLAFLISVFSPLLLTGKNVLFSAARFEFRETRADRYAAQKLESVKQVTEGLEAMNRLSQDAKVNTIPGATPTVVSFDQSQSVPSSVLEQVFGFFYGDFAVTKAHPSFEERIDDLNQSN